MLKDGRIALERYALGLDETCRWTSFSVAKSITSTLLGIAIHEGRIGGIDDAVTRYLPGLNGSAYDGVTLRQILNMTSGVKWNEDYSDPESDVNRCHRATDKSLGSPLVTYLAKLPREAPPGAKWVYKTAETDLAGELVMAATGKPLAAYLSEKIWSRFGMERDGFWMTLDGKEYGGCCLSISLRDYGRFPLFFSGPAKDALPPGWLQRAVTPTVASLSALAGHGGPAGYGFQWWVEAGQSGAFSARGIFGQSIYANPAEKLIIVTLSAWQSPLDAERRRSEARFQQAVIAATRQ